ncbi:hypothetical protein BDN72DRAFT_381271 [Pluteus cervinus]|uniref:Uncharacterized protein n=1 Tax=Pluteus cervinus TaxID=181527 RepID=A0ACD3B3B7_9AGAR|nr:hypothetical protein BDN72DRAFT_381271 [Pluteus cervinus]
MQRRTSFCRPSSKTFCSVLWLVCSQRLLVMTIVRSFVESFVTHLLYRNNHTSSRYGHHTAAGDSLGLSGIGAVDSHLRRLLHIEFQDGATTESYF